MAKNPKTVKKRKPPRALPAAPAPSAAKATARNTDVGVSQIFSLNRLRNLQRKNNPQAY